MRYQKIDPPHIERDFDRSTPNTQPFGALGDVRKQRHA